MLFMLINVGDKFTFSLGSLYATFALSAAAMVLCVIIAPLLFLNSYQTVTTWWKGPPMLYLLSFITGKLKLQMVLAVLLTNYRYLLFCTRSCPRNGGSGNIFGLLYLGFELGNDLYRQHSTGRRPNFIQVPAG